MNRLEVMMFRCRVGGEANNDSGNLRAAPALKPFHHQRAKLDAVLHGDEVMCSAHTTPCHRLDFCLDWDV
jgi:hypothetical protein